MDLKVQVSYFPLDQVRNEPYEEATFPFVLEGEFAYIVKFLFFNDSNGHEELFNDWSLAGNQIPIHSLAEIYDFQQQEYEELFKQYNIEFNYIKGSQKDTVFVKAVLQASEQFRSYYPYLYANGCMMNVSLWSFNGDVFTIEEREHDVTHPITPLVKLKWNANTPIVTLTKSSTVFWVGHDGDFITGISNHPSFATIKDLQGIMPSGIELVEEDDEWD
ncbi:hypothetical protein ACFQPF_03935 [Fictibacillus iocasae]|uniref:Uncharacterized protein n=1 Tax=Fictibacillus iocasae TaxID=2715437 RepID=A0ABW2NJH2_9BACL